MYVEIRKFKHESFLLLVAEGAEESDILDRFFKHEFKLITQNRADSQSLTGLSIELCTDDAHVPYIRVKR